MTGQNSKFKSLQFQYALDGAEILQTKPLNTLYFVGLSQTICLIRINFRNIFGAKK